MLIYISSILSGSNFSLISNRIHSRPINYWADMKDLIE